VNSRLKSRLERLESQIIPRQGERQVMEIQFISPDRVVARTLTVTLGPAMPSQSGKFDRQRLTRDTYR
jgi:hypothetical protein